MIRPALSYCADLAATRFPCSFRGQYDCRQPWPCRHAHGRGLILGFVGVWPLIGPCHKIRTRACRPALTSMLHSRPIRPARQICCARGGQCHADHPSSLKQKSHVPLTLQKPRHLHSASVHLSTRDRPTRAEQPVGCTWGRCLPQSPPLPLRRPERNPASREKCSLHPPALTLTLHQHRNRAGNPTR